MLFNQEYEGRLPEEYPACRQCGSTERYALAVPTHRNIGAYCERRHFNKWFDKEWIPHYLFLEGERYYEVLPPFLFTAAHKKRRSGEFRINERRRAQILLEQNECVLCHARPFEGTNPNALIKWLARYRRPLFERVMEYLSKIQPPPSATDWADRLTAELQFEIHAAIVDSQLTVDHGIPVQVQIKVEQLLSPAVRKFASEGPLFALCRPCNNGKSGQLPRSQQEFEDIYVRVYYDGKRAIAMADGKRWSLLQALCTVVFAENVDTAAG